MNTVEMSFSEFCESISDFGSVKNKNEFLKDLCIAAKPNIIIDEDKIKNWKRKKGNYKGYQSEFLPNIKDEDFKKFLKGEIGDEWTVVQKNFSTLNKRDKINCNTDDENIFFTSVLCQFRKIVKLPWKKYYIPEINLKNNNVKPYIEMDKFIGREDYFKLIDEKLNKCNYIFLEGMDGIGKTELAKAYAYNNSHKYNIIQLINYENDIEYTIAKMLKFENYNENTCKTNDIDIYNEKIRLLNNLKNEKILIIIDDYNEKANENLIKFIDIITNKQYKVIFISRVKHEDIQHINNKSILKVNALPKEHQLSLFRVYYNDNTVKLADELIKPILDEVNGHTLVIRFIAMIMKKGHYSSLEDLLKKLKDETYSGFNEEFLIDLENKPIIEQTMYKHLLTVFNISKIAENSDFSFILKNIALINNSGINKTTFYDWALSEHYKNKKNYNDINKLHDYSWLQIDNENISLHPVIRNIVIEELKPTTKDCKQLIYNINKNAQEALNEHYIKQTKANEYLSFLCKYIYINDYNESIINSYYLNAELFNRLGKFECAISYYKKALKALITIKNEKSHFIIERIHVGLSFCYSELGMFDEAIDSLLVAEKICIQMENGNILLTETYQLLGRLYIHPDNQNKDLDLANKYYQLQLETIKKIPNEYTPVLIADSKHKQGCINIERHRFNDAISNFNEAIKIYENEFTENDLRLAYVYAAIAQAYYYSKQTKNAMEFFEKSYCILNEMNGDNHTNTLMISEWIKKIKFEYRLATTSELESLWDKNIADNIGDSRWVIWKESFIRNNKENKCKTFAFICDKEPMGEGTLLLSPETDAISGRTLLANGTTIANINALRIDKTFEGKGHISKLIKAMESYAAIKGFTTLTIGVEAKETRNLAIYLHWGYNNFIMSEIEDGELVLYYSKQL